MEPYSDELSFAADIVRTCARDYVRSKEVRVNDKGNDMDVHDVVTDLDISTEKRIRDEIRRRYPGDSFIGEETAEDGSLGKRSWILDPIDGTLNFVRGIPLFGTQLALLVGERPVMSVIYLPVYDMLFTATEEGAFLNGKPVHVADGLPLKECIVAMCDFSRKDHRFREVQYSLIGGMYDKVARMKMFGAACCDFAYLACGKADIHFRYMNHIWDFLPGLYLCEKAGAYIDPELKEKGFLLMAATEQEAHEFRREVIGDIQI